MVTNELDFGEILRELQSEMQIKDPKTRTEFNQIINQVLEMLESKVWNDESDDYFNTPTNLALFDKIVHGDEVDGDEDFDNLIGNIENLFWELDSADESDTFGTDGWRHVFGWEF